jgi:hypothetical protein
MGSSRWPEGRPQDDRVLTEDLQSAGGTTALANDLDI